MQPTADLAGGVSHSFHGRPPKPLRQRVERALGEKRLRRPHGACVCVLWVCVSVWCVFWVCVGVCVRVSILGVCVGVIKPHRRRHECASQHTNETRAQVCLFVLCNRVTVETC
jgi:hypothetical protein